MAAKGMTRQGVRDLNGMKPPQKPRLPAVVRNQDAFPVNASELRAAKEALDKHRAVLAGAMNDLGMSSWPSLMILDEVDAAIARVLDGYRSDEVRGGG